MTAKFPQKATRIWPRLHFSDLELHQRSRSLTRILAPCGTFYIDILQCPSRSRLLCFHFIRLLGPEPSRKVIVVNPMHIVLLGQNDHACGERLHLDPN